MIQNIKNHIPGDFIKNIFTLLSGATIAQVIALISIPVLTRMYTPEDFGYIAIYLSITNIIASVSTGRYELAIMLPKKKSDSLAIFKGTLSIVALASISALLLIILFKNFNNPLSNFIKPGYFYLLPASIFLVALSNMFLQWFTRVKKFQLQAKTKIIKSSSNSGINIAMGYFFNLKSWGLFLGHIGGQLSQFIFFSGRFIKTELNEFKKIEIQQIKQQLQENRNFPYFSAPMAFLNSVSVDILIYVFNIFYSTTLVGLYSNANKVINYPLNLISQSFTSVFYQKIAETDKKLKLYTVSYFINLLLASLAMTPIVLWGEEIFAFVLGDEWETAGSIAKYLAPLTITSFAMRSVSNIFSLTRKHQILLIWQSIYLLVILITIFVSKNEKFEIMLVSISFIGAFLYIALAIIGFRIMKLNYEEPV